MFAQTSLLLATVYSDQNAKNERLKLEEVILDGYTRKASNITWKSSREIVYQDSDGNLMNYDIHDGWKSILASNASVVRLLLLFKFQPKTKPILA